MQSTHSCTWCFDLNQCLKLNIFYFPFSLLVLFAYFVYPEVSEEVIENKLQKTTDHVIMFFNLCLYVIGSAHLDIEDELQW